MTNSFVTNDKLAQAKAAANQTVVSSGSQDYLSILSYDNKQRLRQPFVRKSGNVSNLSRGISNIGASGPATHIGASLNRGIQTFDSVPSGTSEAAIILTDGTPVRAPNSNDEVINNIVPKYNNRNVCLYTVGFGENADETFMKQIASASECGTYEFAAEEGESKSKSENTLDEVLTDIKGTVSGEQKIDTDSGNVTGGDAISKSYTIDDSVNVQSVTIDVGEIPKNNISLSDVGRTTIQSASESSLVSTTQSGDGTVKLIDPDGNIIASSNQDVEINVIDGQVTYRIEDPKSGQWSYEIVNQGSDQISYQTDVAADAQASLDVSTAADTYYETGSATVTSLFYGQNGNIENAVVTANVTQPDGTNKTVSFTEVDPGVYTADIDLPDDGSYSITTNAKKNNLARQSTKTITAKSLSNSPVSVSTQSSGTIDAGKSGTVNVEVSVGSGSVSQQLDVGISELAQVGGNAAIQTSKISIGTQRTTIAAGSSQTVTASVDVPASAADGTYNGTASVYRPDGSVVTDTVSVEVDNPLPAGAVYKNPNGPPAKFDADTNGKLDRGEVTTAVNAFFNDPSVDRGDVTKVVNAYFDSQ